MNERIFELAKQADIIHWDSLPSGARTPDHESVVKAKKFAELIVKECIDQGKQIQSQTVSNGSEDYNEGRKMGIEVFMNQIKKHFRGEE